MYVGNKTSEEEAVKTEIDKYNADIMLKDEARIAEEKRLQAHNEALEKVRNTKEWYEEHAAKLGKFCTILPSTLLTGDC
jgi:hypothetical protein